MSFLTKSHLSRGLVIALVASGIFVNSVVAQPGPPQPNEGWSYSLGGGMLLRPTYEGSDEYDFWPIPYFDIRYGENIFISPWQGIGYEKKTDTGFKYGFALGFDFGRDEDDGDNLVGLEEIDFGLLASLDLGYEVAGFDFGVKYSQEFTGVHGGYEVQASIGKAFFLRETRSILAISLNSTYSSSDYLDTYFGLHPVNPAISALPRLEIDDSSFKNVGISVFYNRPINEKWSFRTIFSASQFVGDVKDSPLVLSDNQFFGGFFFVRKM